MITASLNEYRQSPRKVRLVANLIKGKRVSVALDILKFADKRAADPLAKLINSAVANAKNNFSIDSAELFVKDMRVDKGEVLMRRMPRARGSANPIRKRSSHIIVTLEEKTLVAPKEVKAEKKAPKATEAKK